MRMQLRSWHLDQQGHWVVQPWHADAMQQHSSRAPTSSSEVAAAAAGSQRLPHPAYGYASEGPAGAGAGAAPASPAAGADAAGDAGAGLPGAAAAAPASRPGHCVPATAFFNLISILLPSTAKRLSSGTTGACSCRSRQYSSWPAGQRRTGGRAGR